MKKNILIVDDDSSFISRLINKITNKKISFSIADSIKRAKLLIENNNYDLILANVKVPGGCSLDLKKDSKNLTSETDFLFMSSIDSDYNYINNNGEKCCHKYDIGNFIESIIK